MSISSKSITLSEWQRSIMQSGGSIISSSVSMSSLTGNGGALPKHISQQSLKPKGFEALPDFAILGQTQRLRSQTLLGH